MDIECCHISNFFIVPISSYFNGNILFLSWLFLTNVYLSAAVYCRTVPKIQLQSTQFHCVHIARWRHQIEIFSALLAICAGNSPVPGELTPQRPVMRSFDVFFDLRLNIRLSKQSWGWWFETLSRPINYLWCHSNSFLSLDGLLWSFACASLQKVYGWEINFYCDVQFLRDHQ